MNALDYLYKNALIRQKEIIDYINNIKQNHKDTQFKNVDAAYNYFSKLNCDTDDEDATITAKSLWMQALTDHPEKSLDGLLNAINAYVNAFDYWYEKVGTTKEHK